MVLHIVLAFGALAIFFDTCDRIQRKSFFLDNFPERCERKVKRNMYYNSLQNDHPLKEDWYDISDARIDSIIEDADYFKYLPKDIRYISDAKVSFVKKNLEKYDPTYVATKLPERGRQNQMSGGHYWFSMGLHKNPKEKNIMEPIFICDPKGCSLLDGCINTIKNWKNDKLSERLDERHCSILAVDEVPKYFKENSEHNLDFVKENMDLHGKKYKYTKFDYLQFYDYASRRSEQ